MMGAMQPAPASGQLPAVCVVDGNPSHGRQVASALASLFRVDHYQSASQALTAMRADPPAVVMVDETIPPKDGFAFITSLRREESFSRLPIIATSASDPGLASSARQCGADLALRRPYRRSTLVKAISSLRNRDVELTWDALPPHQREALNGTMDVFNGLADAVASGDPIPFSAMAAGCRPLVEAVGKCDFKGILAGVKDHDDCTYVHSIRVATLLTLFGQAAGLPASDRIVLASGGLLHDVGKMAIPQGLLNKPGKLDDAEFAVIKGHVDTTVRLLRAVTSIPEPVITIAAQHHERLNGKGYPHGLAGGQVDELARMAAIADVFSALTERRSYKAPIAADKALALMSEMDGHLDQHLLRLFRGMLLDAGV